MIGARFQVWISIAALLTGTAPFEVGAQVTGKERVPGGVENMPTIQGTPMPGAAAPRAPALERMPAPVMAPPAAASGSALPAASPPPSVDKATPPPKSSKKKSKRSGRSQSDDAAKPGEAPSTPILPGIGGGGDERRPGGVERAPAQPQ